MQAIVWGGQRCSMLRELVHPENVEWWLARAEELGLVEGKTRS